MAELLSSQQTVSTVKGAVIGGLATGAAVALAPVLLPAIGLGALGAALAASVGAVPWIGAGVGGWLGYNSAKQ